VAFEYPGPNRIADGVMKSTGAVLAGRRWYDVATARYRGRSGIYGGAWEGPVFVLTHELPDAPADEGITFLGPEHPDGLVAEAIPVESTIVSCSDAFNAMTTDRSYRAAMSLEDAIEELQGTPAHSSTRPRSRR
jgi:hypothetical protein